MANLLNDNLDNLPFLPQLLFLSMLTPRSPVTVTTNTNTQSDIVSFRDPEPLSDQTEETVYENYENGPPAGRILDVMV